MLPDWNFQFEISQKKKDKNTTIETLHMRSDVTFISS